MLIYMQGKETSGRKTKITIETLAKSFHNARGNNGKTNFCLINGKGNRHIVSHEEAQKYTATIFKSFRVTSYKDGSVIVDVFIK